MHWCTAPDVMRCHRFRLMTANAGFGVNCGDCDKRAGDFGAGALVGALLVGVVWLAADAWVPILAELLG